MIESGWLSDEGGGQAMCGGGLWWWGCQSIFVL